MTKSELIERLATQQSHIPAKAVEDAVKEMLEHMASTLAQGERIEIRGFGSFSLHYRAPRTGRNPKTGDKVELEGKYVPHFKPGKETARSRQYLRLSFNAKLEPEKSTSRVLFSFIRRQAQTLFDRKLENVSHFLLRLTFIR